MTQKNSVRRCEKFVLEFFLLGVMAFGPWFLVVRGFGFPGMFYCRRGRIFSPHESAIMRPDLKKVVTKVVTKRFLLKKAFPFLSAVNRCVCLERRGGGKSD